MFRATVLVLGLAFSSAQLLAIPSWLVPSPISIAITVGKWLNSDEVYYIRVQGRGATEAEARDQAFRFAVDQAIGSLLVSETEVTKDGLKRHDVINYSSGFVQDFEYVDRANYQGDVYLLVDVWVSRSDIAERVFGKSRTDANIAGEKLDQSLKSLQIQQKNADRLNSVVLGDYPYKSYKITINGSEQFVNAKRQPVLRLKYAIEWDEKYLSALKESLTTTSSRFEQENYIVFKSFWGRSRPSYMDAYQYRLYWDNLYDNGTTQMIQLWSIDGSELYKACVGKFVDQMGNNAMQLGHSGIMINESYNKRFYHDINLTNISLETLESYTIQVVRFKDCN